MTGEESPIYCRQVRKHLDITGAKDAEWNLEEENRSVRRGAEED